MPNTYEYVGEYPAYRAYLLRYICEACEEYSYSLVNKSNGKEIATFSAVPHFSKDGKLALTLDQLFSDSPTALYCTRWKDKEPAYVFKEFGTWAPAGEMFWSEDNCFYAEVVPRQQPTNPENNLNRRANPAYIRIKIKGATPTTEN